MRLAEVDLLNIQCFVYYLFTGTLHPQLIGQWYVFYLVREPHLLENVFLIFTGALRQQPLGERSDNRAEAYLVTYFAKRDLAQALLATA